MVATKQTQQLPALGRESSTARPIEDEHYNGGKGGRARRGAISGMRSDDFGKSNGIENDITTSIDISETEVSAIKFYASHLALSLISTNIAEVQIIA